MQTEYDKFHPEPSAPSLDFSEIDHYGTLMMVASFGERRYEMVNDAAETGNIRTLQMFFRVGVSRDHLVSGKRPIHAAVLKDRVKTVKFLIESQADVNLTTRSSNTPLHLAAKKGNKALVKMLLEAKAEVNVLNSHYVTPLHLAIESGFPEVVDLLCQKGAAVHGSGRKDSSDKPLHLAASTGKLESVVSLLQQRAEVDALDYKGRTPLIRAIQSGHVDSVNALLARNADANFKGAQDLTPLHYAALQSEEIVALLLSYGASPHNVSKKQSSPLHLAAGKGNLAAVRLLLTHNADAMIRDSERKSAYECALDANHVEVAKLLEQHTPKSSLKTGFPWLSK